MVLDQSYMFLDAGLTGPCRFPVYGVLVEHPQGNFLFDTGFDASHTRSVAAFTEPQQSAEHCGGNKHCTHATTVCHRCELDVLKAPGPQEELAYSEISFAPKIREGAQAATSGAAPDIYTPRFETLAGDQEIAKGVVLFETIGHTPGHYSLMVRLAHRRPMLFTADACYTQKNLDMMCIQAGNHDPAQALQSLQRLKDLAQQHDAELLFSHDPESWLGYRRGPAYYS
jgi:4-pyridoxolactonase